MSRSGFRSLGREVRYSFRSLGRSPGFTLAAVLTLALGIGANSAVFSVVRAVLLSPLPFDEPHELVVVGGQLPGLGSQDLTASSAEFRDYVERASTLDGLTATWPINANLTSGERPERARVVLVSHDFLSVLREEPMIGRDFTAGDTGGNIGYVCILSYRTWRRLFNGDPDIVGRTLRLDDDPIEVVGVMPERFVHPLEALTGPVDAWVPLELSAGSRFDSRSFRPYSLIGRLADGATLERSRAEFRTIAAHLRAEYPDAYPDDTGWTITVVSVLERITGRVEGTLHVLFASVGLVLLLACTNVANLLLSRGSARTRELAIRSALGGERKRIGRLLLTESLLLALAGGALAILVASIGAGTLRTLSTRHLPRAETISVDASVLLFTLAVAVASSFLFGALPALQFSRPNLEGLLRQGMAGSSRPGSRLRQGLVVAQIGLSVVLLVGAGLVVRSLTRVLAVDPGFEPAGVLALQTWLPIPNDPAQGRFRTLPRRISFFEDAMRELEQTPGVDEVAVTSLLPLRGLNGAPLLLEGVDDAGRGPPATAEVRIVSPGYFSVMGIPLRAGRLFAAADDTSSAPVAVIDQALADRHLPGVDPVGRGIRVGGRQARVREILGVVGSVRHGALDETLRGTVYLTYRQQVGLDMTFVLKATGRPEALVVPATAAVQRVDRDQPIFAVATMRQVIAQTVAWRRLLTVLMTLFAAVAVILAAVGLSGVIAYSVSRRDREIGIRMALGADSGSILRLVLRQGAVLSLIGIVFGLLAAAALGGSLSTRLYEIDPLDAPVVIAVLALTAGVTLAALLVPARRATRVDPMHVMRAE